MSGLITTRQINYNKYHLPKQLNILQTQLHAKACKVRAIHTTLFRGLFNWEGRPAIKTIFAFANTYLKSKDEASLVLTHDSKLPTRLLAHIKYDKNPL